MGGDDAPLRDPSRGAAVPIQGKACTGSFMGRLSFARTPDPQFVLHSHVHVMSSGRVVTALESCAKGFVFTNTNDSNVGGAVKTRIGPDMCARRRERVSFLDVFHSGRVHTTLDSHVTVLSTQTHTQSHTLWSLQTAHGTLLCVE